MRMFGNLTNRIQEGGDPVEPHRYQVGDGCTRLMWSDRVACTVIEVGPRKIVVQTDTAIRTDSNGMSEHQSYAHTPNPNGSTRTYTLRKNGCWVAQYETMQGGEYIRPGRSTYHDYSM